MFAENKPRRDRVVAGALASACLLWQTSLLTAQEKPKAGQPPVAAEKGDEAAIRAGATAYENAFNFGDAKAVAGMWAEDGEFVNELGQKFQGRAAIEKELAGIFANQPGAKIKVTIDSIKFVSPDVALETGTTVASSKTGPAGDPVAYTAVQVRRDGRWQLSTVNESRPVVATAEQRLAPVSWLVGEWKAALDKGKTYRMTCQWLEGKSFLSRTFSVSDAQGVVSSGTQILGWDPVLGQIASWTFDSSGGIGHEMWENRGDHWQVEASSVLADGRTSLSTNVLTKTNDNAFTWRSTERSVNEQLLPDTGVVRVERVSQ